jgi:outer membrane protein assembly factor BamB
MEFLMKKMLFSLLLLSLVICCSGRFKLKDPGSLDAPGWRNFRGDPQNTAFVLSPVAPQLELLWRYDAKKPLKSSPIIVGELVVIGSLDKRVHFLDAFSGKERGVYKVSSSVSTPALSQGDRVYFGLDEGKGTFFALDIRNRDVLWKKNLGGACSSPVSCEERILTGTSDGTLWALDPMSGENIWTFKASSSGISTPAREAFASSGSDERIVCFGSADGHLYALNARSGELKWKFEADGGIYSAPAIKNGMVFFGSFGGSLYALNVEDGSLLWKFKTGADVFSSPAAAESLVYIGSNDYFVYAVDQKTGELVWRYETGGLVRSSPIAVGDKLFFGSYDGHLYALNRFTGQLIWKYQTEGMISSSPACFDGKIYIGSEDGFLYCFGS